MVIPYIGNIGMAEITLLLSVFIPLAMVWTLPWKGVALWRAARNRHLVWFVVLFLVNTLALLEIVYIFGFSRKRELA